MVSQCLVETRAGDIRPVNTHVSEGNGGNCAKLVKLLLGWDLDFIFTLPQ